MSVYAFLMGMGVAPIAAFLPLYATEALQLGATAAGWAVAVMGIIGVIFRIAAARATERLDSFLVPLVWLSFIAALAALAILAATYGRAFIWLGAFLAGIGAMTWNAVAMLAVVVRIPQRRAGWATGLVFLGFMAGYTVSPVAIGVTVDMTGQWHVAWIAVSVVFLMAGFLAAATRRLDRAPSRE